VEFLLLGPLEARIASASPQLGGPRQRAVLADLLLHAGSVVSMDTLIDDLWGAEPPPTADAVVQNAVSRLRQALGKEVIETRPPGYLLRVDPGAIDARRFERLVHDAKPLPPAERSAALRDALALWRGPAFGDLAFESFLQAEIARLDELRLTALEDRIEAEIELGRHDGAIPDAATLAARHPDRERLCRLLMLALARAGRQQEALDAYASTRRALDEQWGLEPSPETRALHQMILTQDAAIAPARPVPQAVGPVRRPVSLLLVEPLVDDDVELEAAGKIFRDVRRTVADVVSRHGGALSPESGVELIAAFGVDGAHEDGVVRAARAAVELREILRAREVDARYAVGTGRILVEDARPVLVGAVVGRSRRALHDADANEIQLTEVAARLGGEAFELDADGRLLGVRSSRPAARGARGPLVGRSAELALLQAAFDGVVEHGSTQHVVIVGEAGIGKSRLVGAFAEEVPAVLLETACIPYGEGISFLPLRELAERAAALDAGAPELGELSSADAALAAARGLVEHFTADCPVVVVLDDLHWAVPTFLDVVEYVVRAARGPLLVISMTRPELIERRSAWGEGATVLEPLAGDDARLLVDALPERDALDEELAATILETAEGVPLFLEQLAAHAVESELAVDHVPATLDALLASRIDALEPGERAVLSRAAVVGRAFSRESLGALTPSTEARELAGRLGSLERRRLVRPRGPEHEFVHPLVREAAYDAIGRLERAAMHEAFARWLDAHGAADELVGLHLERSVVSRRAMGDDAPDVAVEAGERLGRAGERAAWSMDHAAAISLLTRAASLLPEADVLRLDLECVLSHPLKMTGEWRRALSLLEDVVRRAEEIENRRVAARARVEMVWPLHLMGVSDADALIAGIEEAIAECEAASDTIGLARAWDARYAVESLMCRRFEAAYDALRRANDFYRELGLVGMKDSALVSAAVDGPMPLSDVIALAERLLAESESHPWTEPYLMLDLARHQALMAGFDSAQDLVVRSRTKLVEIGDDLAMTTRWPEAAALVAVLGGDGRSAEEILVPAIEAAAAREDTAWYAYLEVHRAEAALVAGEIDRALEFAKEAEQESLPGQSWIELYWQAARAKGLARSGRAIEAEECVREPLELYETTDNLLVKGQLRLILSEALALQGKLVDAERAASEAASILTAKGATLFVERAKTMLSGIRNGGTAVTAPPFAG